MDHVERRPEWTSPSHDTQMPLKQSNTVKQADKHSTAQHRNTHLLYLAAQGDELPLGQ
jgi:hypothetical protein